MDKNHYVNTAIPSFFNIVYIPDYRFVLPTAALWTDILNGLMPVKNHIPVHTYVPGVIGSSPRIGFVCR